MTGEIALAVRNVTKSYGATVALAGMSLDLRAGEIHAILGENGAGKSTLVKILSGVVAPDHGEIRLNGERFAPASILGARSRGISTGFQEISLVPNLSVAENLLLPRLGKGSAGLNSRRRTWDAAGELLARFDVTDIDLSRPVRTLSLAEKQRIEIVRALSHARNVLVLDEPSASLADTRWLFEQVRKQARAGVGVLYISHRLSEVRSLCSRGTVLRNGRSIDTVDLGGVSDDEIFQMMVGRSPDTAFPERHPSSISAQPLVDLRGVDAGQIQDASLKIHSGEILGVAALEGQGQRDLFHAIAGLTPVERGEIRIVGEPAHLTSRRAAMKTGPGIAFVPEERKVEGIFSGLRTAGNIAISTMAGCSRFGFVNHAIEQASVAKSAEQVELQPRYLGFRISELSGGNQQKAVIARALQSQARILVLFDPTRGVDVGTKQAVYKVVREFADHGGAVLIYSSELPELVHLCDRCSVVYGGQITEEFTGAEITEQALIAGVVGHRGDQPAVAEAG
ncbi:sugar ABC transporter ATP-binding protein [Rhodovibrio salinarum]|nr:sugar ABC transporter ATP-binding protein [Rhodovibrio salinarum]